MKSESPLPFKELLGKEITAIQQINNGDLLLELNHKKEVIISSTINHQVQCEEIHEETDLPDNDGIPYGIILDRSVNHE